MSKLGKALEHLRESISKSRLRMSDRVSGLVICVLLTHICGCAQLSGADSALEEANRFFSRGNYKASLSSYARIIEKYPGVGDRVLFEMGIIHAHPANQDRDYRKSLECFEQLIRNYPGSGYRQDSEMMVFHINNGVVKDKVIEAQRERIETLGQAVTNRDGEIASLQKRIEALRARLFESVIGKGAVDRILVEKEGRRLMLVYKGEVIKTYRIALGGNPVGPKEREGDNKTPEGTYSIDSRNRDSQYHLSLHISYPSEKDRARARELGVSPGGDIMIHGIKRGMSWVGDFHSSIDWTKGCIAVTDEEIEEIDKLAPDGTVVEIRP